MPAARLGDGLERLHAGRDRGDLALARSARGARGSDRPAALRQLHPEGRGPEHRGAASSGARKGDLHRRGSADALQRWLSQLRLPHPLRERCGGGEVEPAQGHHGLLGRWHQCGLNAQGRWAVQRCRHGDPAGLPRHSRHGERPDLGSDPQPVGDHVRPPRAFLASTRSERGVTLIELMMALVVLSIGLLAVAQLFPAGTRGQIRDRLYSSANYYAQEQLEEVSQKNWADPGLALGRHPAADFDTLGPNKTWRRFYQVDAMAAPLDNLRKVTVTVNWDVQTTSRSVSVLTYVRR